MKEHFQRLLDIEGVEGVIYLNMENEVEFSEFRISLPDKVETLNWPTILDALGNMAEAEFVFDNRRIYFKKSAAGYIFVLIDRFLSLSMVRMNCDIIFPAIAQLKKGKGLGRFFGRK